MRRGGSAGVGESGGGGVPSGYVGVTFGLRWAIFFCIWGVCFMRFFDLILDKFFLALFQFVGVFGCPKGGHF